MELLSRLVQSWRLFAAHQKGYCNIADGVVLESHLVLDTVHPSGIHIGANTLVASHSIILCHEHIKRDPNNPKLPFICDTYIGKNCFIGVGACILPGVHIGDEVVVGAATVVTKDVPSGSVIVGNPGRVVRRGIQMDERAMLRVSIN